MSHQSAQRGRVHPRRVIACLVLVSAWLTGCASGPSPVGAAPADEGAARDGAWGRTVQLLHRNARGDDGTLSEVAVAAAADEAARVVYGERYAFAAWRRLLPETGPAHVVAHPTSGPLAKAVVGRLRLVAGDPSAVELIETAAEDQRPPRPPAVVVWRPGWRGGRLQPDLPPELSAELILVDLVEPSVGDASWRADAVVGAPQAAEAVVVTRYVLEGRAQGRLPDAAQLAARAGLTWRSDGWLRWALVD